MKMKVLHVVGAMNMGGTETMLMNVFRSLDREKVQFDFISFTNQDAYYDEEIRNLGGRIIYVSKSTSVFEIKRVIQEFGPYDVIHSHTLFNCGIANLAAKIAGVPIRIAHAHTTLDSSDGFIRKLYINLMQKLIKVTSTHFLSCSQAAATYLFGNKITNSSKYMYLPNMIDYASLMVPNQETIQQFKQEYQLENRFVIGHVGRLTKAKNHRFLIDLIEQIKNVKKEAVLLLVGDGQLRSELELLVQEKQLQQHVIFTGLQTDVSNALYNMDVFVFPSIFEGLGLVLLEAQLCGLPCVVSEAIQPEADLGMNLMTTLQLNEGVNSWCDEILEKVHKQEVDLITKQKALSNKGYTSEQIINRLVNIYQGGDV